MSAEGALSQIFHTYILPVLCAELGSAQVCPTLSTPWTAAHQAPLPMGILQARVMEWVAMPCSRGSSQPRDQTQVSRTASEFFII